jgi:Putative Ig domain
LGIFSNCFHESQFELNRSALEGGHVIRNFLRRLTFLVCGLLVTCLFVHSAAAQIVVSLDPTHIRSGFKPTFYGINGQGRNGAPWANKTGGVLDNPGFAGTGITVTSGGSGYTSAPTVTISAPNCTAGPDCVQATATATVSGGSVTAITISSGGLGYKPAPQITYTGGGGAGAAALAIVSATGVVTAVLPTNIGSGYTSVPTITIAANPAGSGATATATLSGGSITGYTVTAGGSGYTPAPQVTFSGGGGTSANAMATVSAGEVGGALQQLQMGVLRFPAGTGGNYWDWNTGDFVGNYYYTTVPSQYTSPLSEWQAELTAASQSSGTATQGLFVLNMLTDPTCVPTAPNPYCTPGPGSPNLSYQKTLLSTANGSYVKPAYIELGNEYYLDNACYNAVYPVPSGATSNGGVYAAAANNWITGIQSVSGYSGAKIAAVASHIGGNSTRAAWNNTLMYGDGQGNGPLTGATAVTLHIYEASGLGSGTVVSASNADTMLYMPFSVWSTGTNSVLNTDLPSLTNTTTGYNPNIWVTEYNLRDANVAAFGTWAHGLFTATMSLLFLESSRIQMAIHHDVQGGTVYADVLESSNAFAQPSFSLTSQPALPNGVISTPYSEGLSAGNGVPPYTWSLVSGTLPTSVSLSSGGVVSGTPSSGSAGTYSFSAKVTDSTSASVTQNFSLVIQSSGTPTLDCSGGGVSSSSTFPTNGANILTRVNGLTAQGLTTREINTAALGQGKAQRLAFGTGVPYFADGITPELYGWIFSGGTSVPTETVILNLSGSAETVDLSGITGLSTGNSLRQISATDPGTYVTGGIIANGFEGVDYNMPLGSTTQPVTLTNGTIGTSYPLNALPLPAFSLTRIY